MTVTMALIARRLNLSQATVSRVLSGKGKGFISEATRKRVFAVAAELGYAIPRPDPDRPPRRAGVVALWSRNANSPYYARIVREFQRAAAADGSDLILSSIHDEEREHDFDHQPMRPPVPAAWNRVDGIIAVDCIRRVEAYLLRRRNHASPIVVAGSLSFDGVDSVWFDPHRGVEAAIDHLLRLGRKRIVQLTGSCAIPSIASARSETYARMVRSEGQEPLILTAADESRAASRIAVREAFASRRDCDAIFCLNDDLAIGAYRGLLDIGLRVPRDVAIVGYDSIEDTEYLEVPITSVRQDPRQLCARAWDLLWRRINEPGSETVSELLLPELDVRRSCGVSDGSSSN